MSHRAHTVPLAAGTGSEVAVQLKPDKQVSKTLCPGGQEPAGACTRSSW